ncbi:MAG TPA: efflux RND transporter periplasmic adaptor subunit [Syntrophorhabdaceae bacterium]|nr:efflux RND transporter periplasmic adaptor subunit [Syntrophorhabdaceae bacterium]
MGKERCVTKNIRLIAVLTALGALLAGCGTEQKGDNLQRQKVTGVTTTQVQPKSVNSYYETTGNIAAKITSAVSSRVMGAVTAINVQEGDIVRTGDVLAVLDNRDSIQRIRAAEAAVSEAEHARDAAAQQRSLADLTYQRYKNLFDEKVISRQEFDQINAQKSVADAEYGRISQSIRRAQAGLEEARVQSAFFQVRSPISGVVAQKRIESGVMAMPGMHLFTIEDVSQYKIDAAVDAALQKSVFRNMTVQVLPESLDKPVIGKVTKIVPAIDPASRTFAIEIALDRGHTLRSGAYAKVLVPTGKKEAITIPLTAVVQRGQLLGVFAVDKDGIISYRLIKTGRVYGEETEVLSGLDSGEIIITSGMGRAVDGGIIAK